MDNSTSNNFTCPEVENITTVITPSLFQRNRTYRCSARNDRQLMWIVYNKTQSKKNAPCDESWDKGQESSPRESAISPTCCICHTLSMTSLLALNSQRTFYTQIPHLINLDGSLQGMEQNYLIASLSKHSWVLFPSYSKLSLLWTHTGQKLSSPFLAAILPTAPPGRKMSLLKTTLQNSNVLTPSPV